MPTTTTDPSDLRTRLGRSLRALTALLAPLGVALLVAAGGCLSNPTPHPGVDPDNAPTTGHEGDSDTRETDYVDDLDGGTPPAGLDGADGCHPALGDSYGDVGADGCGAADASPGDACQPGTEDAAHDTGPCEAPTAGESAAPVDTDVGPSAFTEPPE
jgi:hypothetical protein